MDGTGDVHLGKGASGAAGDAEVSKCNIRCAWCGRDMGWVDGLEPGDISRGICDVCLKAACADYDDA